MDGWTNPLICLFYERIQKYSIDQLVFLDETGKDDRTPSRNYGYSLIGKCAMLKTIYVWGKRFTVEAALGIQGI